MSKSAPLDSSILKQSDKSKEATPNFPHWNEVIDSLFKTKTFIDSGLNSESQAHFMQQLKTLNSKYVFPISEPDLMVQSFESSSLRKLGLTDLTESEVIKQYKTYKAEANQFTLVGDARSMDFLHIDENVLAVMDIPAADEFSLARICGMDDAYELYHPEDVIHIIRLGFVALLTISVKGMAFSPFSDYYQVEFRMGFKSPERFKTIRRVCKLSNKTKDEIGTRHFDTWTVLQGHRDFRAVKAVVNIQNNPNLNLAVGALYYITNCILLDITPRDALFANYLDKYGFKHFRQQLNQSCKTYKHLSQTGFTSETGSNIKSNLIKKVNSRIVENTKKQKFRTSIQKRSLHFKCGQLGILGMLNLVEACIWKRAETE